MNDPPVVRAERQRLPSLTDRIQLGSTGLMVSPVCLGGTSDPKTVSAAFEAGINFFFLTADMHWPLYEASRRGLRMLLESNPSARDSIVVAVCSYVTQPEFCSLPFLEVLDALPLLEKIDIAVAGGSYGHELPVRLEVYERHRQERWAGTRAIGSTFHDRGAALEAMREGALDIAFVRYNPPHPGARQELFPHVLGRTSGPALINFRSTHGFLRSEEDYEALGVGPKFWRPRITDYYRFALTQAALDGVLCALSQPSHVADLADALERGPLSPEQQQYLIRLGELASEEAELVSE